MIFYVCVCSLYDSVNVKCTFYLSVSSRIKGRTEIEGVFNTSVVRKLGPNIHEVLGRLLKLLNSFVASLHQMMTLQH